MEKHKRIVLLLLVCGVVWGINFLFEVRRENYYKEQDNYIVAKGYIESFHYSEENEAYYFILKPDWSPQKKSGDPNFKVIGNGVVILKERNIETVLEQGSSIEFSYAPKYFGDGYIRPMVSLKVGDQVLLTFEDGYRGLLETF